MKRICTLSLTLLLLSVVSDSNAQTVSIDTNFPSPAPSPSIGPAVNVNSSNGFTSTSTGTFNNFPKGKVTTIESPLYYYPTTQSTIYFVYNCAVATSGSVTDSPQVSIITSSGDTLSATTTAIFDGIAGINYYFTFTLATPLPANTVFKISLTMDVPNSGKAISANSLATNAISTTAKSPIILPVNFTGLSAKKSGSNVSLTWNVSNEINTIGYEVQRSIDGSSFTTIGFVQASGRSSYNFVDSKTFETSFYRIKSTDHNTNFAYSVVVNIHDQDASVVMKAFPMPVQNVLTVQHSSANSNAKLEVLSVDGRLVKSVILSAEEQQTSVDFSAIKSGVYVLRLVNNNSMESLKIVKQ
jgi:hypothetical protein